MSPNKPLTFSCVPDVQLYPWRSVLSLPLPVQDLEERLLLPGAVAAVLVAAGEGGHQITLLVLPSICVGAGDVGVEQRLRDHGQLGENSTMPSEFALASR